MLVTSYSLKWSRPTPVQSVNNLTWNQTETVRNLTRSVWGRNDPSDNVTLLKIAAVVPPVDSEVKARWGRLESADHDTTLRYGRNNVADSVAGVGWGQSQATQYSTSVKWGEGQASNNQTLIGYTIGQPVQHDTALPYGAPQRVFSARTIRWGYGVNSFIIGGDTTFPSDSEEPIPDPPIIHIPYKVFRIVNIVNITVRPDNTAIRFDNFSITRDIESFAWSVSFDILARSDYNLVRPQGRSIKTVDININGTVFTVFIGKTQTSRSANNQGVVREVYRCQGWSNLKQLSYPYVPRRSFTSTSANTAAQTVVNELTGTGFTSTWDTTDWQLPIGIHSYQNKTTLGAILEIVNSIGGVIVPDTTTNSFTVRPYYPVSPWNWDDITTSVNREMQESQFFSIDNETIPRDNPNGVFVFGEDDGVAIQATRQGTNGQAMLPDVVNRYMTAVPAAQERARIELGRNSFIERIPMSTYIDENGIIMPQELIEFTETDGVTKWRGMVVETTVNCQRVGTALTQNIVVERFFDG